MASQLLFTENTSAPGTPSLGKLTLYAKTDGYLYGKNDSGTEFLLTGTAALTGLTGDVVAVGPGNAVATIQPGVIYDSMINAAAGIVYSKLNLLGSIVNADINAAAAISYSKLNLTGSIVNADINASAAVALSKLAALGANFALQSDGSGVISVSPVTATELSYSSGVTSSIQIQLNNKQPLDSDLTALAALTTTGLIVRTGAGAAATRQLVQGTGITITNADGVGGNPTISAILSGAFTTDDLPEGVTNLYFTDERAQDAVGGILTDTTTIDLTYNDGANTITADVQANSLTNTHINASAGILYSKLNLTGGIVNADVNAAAAIAYSKLNLLASIVNADINAAAAISYSKLNLTGSIVNADVNAAAAIAYSKLNLLASIVNADVSPTAAIAYSKLNLTGSIVNADINAAAGIVYSKLVLTNSIVNADISATAAIAYSKLTLTNSIVNADINAAAAIAYSKLLLTNSIVNADINASAAISYSKLAALTANRALQSDGSGFVSASAVTNTELGYVAGVTSAIQTQINTKVNRAGDTMTGAFIESVVALTDAATITVDASLGNVFTVTLGGNRTLGAPTNPTNGQKIIFRIRQDATGNRTLAFDAVYRFGIDVLAPVMSTAAAKTDYIGCIYNSTDSKWDVVATSKGY